ncbi:MAG: choice-of-anchor B family protein [Armatimonadetes bacterium]|nr:choice-of-anchor B family protein [Armatimonadota bacterium]
MSNCFAPVRTLAVLLSLAAPFIASCQQAKNVSLYKQFSLTALGTTAGNDCWGYVSPSGREYGIFSMKNKVVFVDVTDPANSVNFAEIPHSASTWGDVKVFRDVAYAVTETQGTGIQVIDMSNIDNHVVTLVKTITSPGRTHNLSLDTVSGFLYTCGSRDGTGTTMCFDLKADPRNPAPIGSPSLTTTYQHDAEVYTYTSGPYAGRQIMFGSGESRGVEIWDVTNKNAVTLIRRITYPFIGYCHQGWLSPDQHYWYMDDELDEANFGLTTRTLVFDVSVLETADLVSTYTSGSTAINHNLYNRNNYIFESNYSSGLRIFDANSDPVNPTQVGWYDTFPSDDRTDFVGAWSSYAFFPSGTVITNDINSGAYVLDVSQATKKDMGLTGFTVDRGAIVSGGLAELSAVDGQDLVVKKGLTVNPGEAPIQITFEGTCLWQDISKLQFNLRLRVDTLGLAQTIELYDWTSNTWQQVQQGSAPLADTTYNSIGASPDRFVEQGTRRMKARLSLKASGPTSIANWKTLVDLANWTINP